jgi:hypothetical protein
MGNGCFIFLINTRWPLQLLQETNDFMAETAKLFFHVRVFSGNKYSGIS